MTTFVLNTPIDLTANASVYTGNIGEVMREYDIEISVSQEDLFATRTYQDSGDAVLLDITSAHELKGYNASLTANDLVNGTGILSGTSRTVGDRLVEILAIKLFGNARARAALANETAIAATSVIVNSALVAEAHHIFNEYAALDRTDNENNVDGPKTFNFQGDQFQFHIRLSSTVSGTDASNEAGTQEPAYLVPGSAVGTLNDVAATSFNTSTRELTHCPITLRVNVTA
jgi:hypothetical protein